jgi:hypothetical protein
VLAVAPHEVSYTYTLVDAARVTDLTKRQIEGLVELEVVTPSLLRPGGRRCYLSFAQLVTLTLISRLGLDPGSRQASAVSRQLNELDGPRYLYLEGNRCWRTDSSATEELNAGAPVLMVCDISALQWRVRERLDQAQLPAPPLDAK